MTRNDKFGMESGRNLIMMDEALDNRISVLVSEAARELNSCGTLKQHLKDLVKKDILHRELQTPDMIRWPKGMLLLGLLRAGDIETACEYLDRWIESGADSTSIEDVLAGQTLLELAENQHDKSQSAISISDRRISVYTECSDNMAKYLLSYECDEEGSLPYSIKAHNEHIYADSIGMICPFLMMYGIKNGQQKYINMALQQINNFMKNAIDDKTGLPYHGYRYKDHEKYGIIGWGRAAGWLMMGMSGCLRAADIKERKIMAGQSADLEDRNEMSELKQYYDDLANVLIDYQREDGLWGWNIADTDSQTDTSASAMILYSLSQYPMDKENAGISGTPEVLQRGIHGLEKYITKDGKVVQCQAECGGFGIYPERFGSYPWSVGMTLAFFASMQK
jgi:rhamnogalacturonyl hydrolase YesR